MKYLVIFYYKIKSLHNSFVASTGRNNFKISCLKSSFDILFMKRDTVAATTPISLSTVAQKMTFLHVLELRTVDVIERPLSLIVYKGPNI